MRDSEKSRKVYLNCSQVFTSNNEIMCTLYDFRSIGTTPLKNFRENSHVFLWRGGGGRKFCWKATSVIFASGTIEIVVSRRDRSDS